MYAVGKYFSDKSILDVQRSLFIFNILLGLPDKEMSAMKFGLAYSLSRYKQKFSPYKIDTMIVQVMKVFGWCVNEIKEDVLTTCTALHFYPELNFFVIRP